MKLVETEQTQLLASAPTMNRPNFITPRILPFRLCAYCGAVLLLPILLLVVQNSILWGTYRREQQLIHEIQAINQAYKTEWQLPRWVELAERVLPRKVSRQIPYDTFRYVEAVFIRSDEIDNDWCRHLQNAERLKYVILWAPKLDDRCLQHFSSLKELLYLNIGGSSVTDAGIPQLAKLTTLCQLTLCNTRISDAGIEQLRRLLPGTTVNTEAVEISFPADGN